MKYSLNLNASWKKHIRMPFEKRKRADGLLKLNNTEREAIEKIWQIWYNYIYYMMGGGKGLAL